MPLTLGEMSEGLKKDYHGKFTEQLNQASALVKLMEQERERKEKLIRESLEPWRLWLVDHIKWRRAKRWLVRSFVIKEQPGNYQGENVTITQVWKGKRLIKTSNFPIRELRFVRHSYRGGDGE